MTDEEKIILAVRNEIPLEQLKQLEFFKNRGKHFIQRALIPDRQGKQELAFSNAIKRFYELNNLNLVSVIKSDDPKDLEIAFTVFQWLATNIGRDVLSEALEQTDKVIVDNAPF